MRLKPGFERHVVLAYLIHRGTLAEDRLTFFNEHRVTDSHRDMVDRWRLLDVVPLERFDAFLLKYDVMLWEFELWALERYGRDAFIDPLSDPKELVG